MFPLIVMLAGMSATPAQSSATPKPNPPVYIICKQGAVCPKTFPVVTAPVRQGSGSRK